MSLLKECLTNTFGNQDDDGLLDYGVCVRCLADRLESEPALGPNCFDSSDLLSYGQDDLTPGTMRACHQSHVSQFEVTPSEWVHLMYCWLIAT